MTNAAALQFHTDAPRRDLRRALGLLLYAALTLALGALCGARPFLPALLPGAAVAAAGGMLPARRARTVCLSAAALGAAAFLLPLVRAGGALLVNRLYAASEAANAYAYFYLTVPGVSEPAALRAVWTALGLLLGALCALAAARRWAALALFLAVAALEGYFGLTPARWENLLLFAALAAALLRRPVTARRAASALAPAAAALLLVLLLAPRPIAPVERYSEHLRDELAIRASAALPDAPPPEAETNRTHRESRQREEQAQTDPALEQAQQGFVHQTEQEREISLPHRVDYLRIALLLLAVAALLLVPFLPFLLLTRAQRRTDALRAAFDAEDNAAAIRAAFTHLMDWLRCCGLQTDNRPFAQCAGAVKTLLPDALAARYADAAAIWQEAAYSDHAMTDEQRRAVRALLRDAAHALYERADRRTRLRIKYWDCLCEG